MAKSRTALDQSYQRTSYGQVKAPLQRPCHLNHQVLRGRPRGKKGHQIPSPRGRQPPRLVKVQAVASRAILEPTIYLTAHRSIFQAGQMCPFPGTTRSDIPTVSPDLMIAENQGTLGTLEPRVAIPVNPGIPMRPVTQESAATPERAGMETRNGTEGAVSTPTAERRIAHAIRIAPSCCPHAMVATKGRGPIGTHVVAGLLSHPVNIRLPQRSHLYQLRSRP